ncbi:hypothetical protein CBL_03748 [Carabus blaptoides fortunei]
MEVMLLLSTQNHYETSPAEGAKIREQLSSFALRHLVRTRDNYKNTKRRKIKKTTIKFDLVRSPVARFTNQSHRTSLLRQLTLELVGLQAATGNRSMDDGLPWDSVRCRSRNATASYQSGFYSETTRNVANRREFIFDIMVINSRTYIYRTVSNNKETEQCRNHEEIKKKDDEERPRARVLSDVASAKYMGIYVRTSTVFIGDALLAVVDEHDKTFKLNDYSRIVQATLPLSHCWRIVNPANAPVEWAKTTASGTDVGAGSLRPLKEWQCSRVCRETALSAAWS